MLKYLSVFALFAATLVATGCKPKEQAEAEKAAIKAEQDSLQGKWKFASRSGDDDEDEEEKPTEPNGYLAYTVDGDILRYGWFDKDGKENVWARYKMTLTPGKDPKQVDLTEVDETGKAVTVSKRVSKGKAKPKTTTLKRLAVYKVDGDKLTLCISFADGKRPDSVEPKKGSSAYAVNLEKMK